MAPSNFLGKADAAEVGKAWQRSCTRLQAPRRRTVCKDDPFAAMKADLDALSLDPGMEDLAQACPPKI